MKISVTSQKRTQHRQAPQRDSTLYSATLHLAVHNEIINNKAMHNLMDAKRRWHSDWLDGTVSFREPHGQSKGMQIRQRENTKPPGDNNP